MRTYSRDHFLEARRLWDEGEFSDEWRDYRHAAAMRGFIYPPEGSKWDSWDEDEPTQRAVLIRAIREQPRFLMAAINLSRSWHEVIGQVIAANESAGVDVALAERRERKARMDGEATGPEAALLLRDILTRAAS
jgi:hypothetical protein